MASWLPLVTGSADAAQTTAFLARTSGLSGAEIAAYKNLINGLVSDGVFSLLDALYIFATNTTTTANLNLISTSFGLTGATPPTFIADQGYTGNGTTQFLDTGFIPSSSGVAYTLNNASVGVYDLTNVAGGTSHNTIGANDGNQVFIANNQNASQTFFGVNDSFPSVTGPNTTQGFWVATRTSSSVQAVYRNGNTTALGTDATASSALPTVSIYIMAKNQSGSGTAFSNNQLSAAFIGGGLSAAQQQLISNRINAYMTAFAINVY